MEESRNDNKSTSDIRITDILLLIISLIYIIGIRSFFAPCGPKDDGTYMSCHWAGQAVFAFSILLGILAILHLILKGAQIKTGISVSMICTAAMTAVIPNHLISMCMMNTMRCHAVMTPGIYVLSALTIAVSVIDILIRSRKKA